MKKLVSWPGGGSIAPVLALTTVVVAGAIVVFVFVPVAPVNKLQGGYKFRDDTGYEHVHYGSPKSGLRMAIEGRLKWLGLFDD